VYLTLVYRVCENGLETVIGAERKVDTVLYKIGTIQLGKWHDQMTIMNVFNQFL
jgi:hypothetical protein